MTPFGHTLPQLAVAHARPLLTATWDPPCPSALTLQEHSFDQGAWLIQPNCFATMLELQVASTGDTYLMAQDKSIVYYRNDPAFTVTHVNLSGNPLASASFERYEHELHYLILSHCQLSDLQQIRFPSSPSRLQHLDLSHNTLQSFARDSSLPSNLLTLDASYNRLESLRHIPDTVETLVATHNAIESLVNVTLPSSLVDLDLSHNPLTTIALIPIPPRLQRLNLLKTSIQSFEVRESDLSILQRVEIEPLVESTSCTDDASAKTIGQHTFCVISDQEFAIRRNQFLNSDAATTTPTTSPTVETKTKSTVTLAVANCLVGAILLVLAVLLIRRVIQSRREAQREEQHYYLDACMTAPLIVSPASSPAPMTSPESRPVRQQRSQQAITPTFTSTTGFFSPNDSVISSSPRHILVQPPTSSLPLLGLQSNTTYDHSSNSSSDAQSVSSHSSFGARRSLNALEARELERFRIPHGQLIVHQQLARGSFFHVYAGKLHGSNDVVCIKQLSPTIAMQEQLVIEVMAAIHLSTCLVHPQIVSFLGFSYTMLSNLAMVEEFMAHGDLETILYAQSHANPSTSWSEPTIFPRSKAQIALDVIEALAYLHSLQNPVVHGHLRARNVLLNHQMTAKLSVMEIQRPVSLDQLKSTQVRDHSASWIAPEIFRGEGFSIHADVYALGVLLMELERCRAPLQDHWHHPPSNAEIARVISHGVIHPRPSRECPLEIRQWIERCVRFNAEERPSAVELMHAFRQIVVHQETSGTTSYWV